MNDHVMEELRVNSRDEVKADVLSRLDKLWPHRETGKWAPPLQFFNIEAKNWEIKDPCFNNGVYSCKARRYPDTPNWQTFSLNWNT